MLRFTLIFLICFMVNTRADERLENGPAWNRYLLVGAVVMTWTTVGINEGQKWGENYNLLFHEDYHAYRAFTNLGLISAPLLAMALPATRDNVKLLVCSNLIGWGIYESTLALAEGKRGITEKHGDFHILGLKMPFPSPITSLAFAAVSSIAVQITF